MKLLVIYSSTLSPYLFSLRPKYLPQHRILEHPQRKKPNFTAIHNNRQNYSSLYLDFCIFGLANWKTKDLSLNYSRKSLTSNRIVPSWIKFSFVMYLL